MMSKTTITPSADYPHFANELFDENEVYDTKGDPYPCFVSPDAGLYFFVLQVRENVCAWFLPPWLSDHRLWPQLLRTFRSVKI